jgi:crossover junction endodeoxyribonuclease RuvC
MAEAIRIIGVDPGLRRTGWGVIETLGNSLRFVASGTVKSDNRLDLAARLTQLYDGLEEVLHTFRPFEAAVEHTFVNKDATATLKLGQAAVLRCWRPLGPGCGLRNMRPTRSKRPLSASATATRNRYT